MLLRQRIITMLWLRSILSFLLLPGSFAGLIPLWLVRADTLRAAGAWWWPGLLPLSIGLWLLLWCVYEFLHAGKGTLAPWDPPRHLVSSGLYRYTRNPMYVTILLIITGTAALFLSPYLAGYAVLLALAFHLRVILYEEPTLRHQFGQDFADYMAQVPRWLPRLPHRNNDPTG